MRYKKIRFLWMLLVGIVLSILFMIIMPNDSEGSKFGLVNHFTITIIITMLVWEGNLRIDYWMNQRLPWLTYPGKRIFAELITSVLYSIATIYFSMVFYNSVICKMDTLNHAAMMKVSLTVGVLVSIILKAIETGYQFFLNWKKSVVEVEKYKNESLQAQFQNLKNQLNPHFLFNSLSVLSSLVYKDKDKAVDFISQLASVYRFVLENQNTELVTLDRELTFLKSYMYLHEIRFDKNIRFNVDIKNEKLGNLIPPLALQMLIENAIKHNEISMNQPLTISVTTNGESSIIVKNNLQKRLSKEPGANTGIKNIKERYSFFTTQPVEVIETDAEFIVKLPLLKKHESNNS